MNIIHSATSRTFNVVMENGTAFAPNPIPLYFSNQYQLTLFCEISLTHTDTPAWKFSFYMEIKLRSSGMLFKSPHFCHYQLSLFG